MIVAVVPLHNIKTTLLVVAFHTNNFERMKLGDPITLDGRGRGGMLPDFPYPTVSVLIAYEEDVEKVEELASRKDKRELLAYLERGHKFIPGVDGEAIEIASGTKTSN